MPNKNARHLRKAMTDAEKSLWSVLRNRQLGNFKFRRQRPIGPFIADFVCMERQLIVEADGGQHNENQNDQTRTAWLESNGWEVIRFWNNEILKNLDGVQQRILEALNKRSS
jgi:primosomal protein N' (replication factor Y)